MFRKLIALGALAAFLGVVVVATPAQASGHVRHYTPSRTATVHTASMSHTSRHHVAKLTKNKKGKKHHHGKKHK
jgi:hypothetical protein